MFSFRTITFTSLFLLASNKRATTLAQICTGICQEEGESLINPSFNVKIGEFNTTCVSADSSFRTIETEEECTAAVDAALEGGCKCGVPVPCPGICIMEGEEITNPDLFVVVENRGRTCMVHDEELKGELDEVICERKSGVALAEGCKCAVPVDCAGICLEDGETLLNPNDAVMIGINNNICGNFDAQYKTEIDPDICAENSEAAQAAGCICGPADGSTAAPTGSPTGLPTDGSTAAPTGPPTGSPTASQTNSPTGSPTDAAITTLGPTDSSSGSPTASPVDVAPTTPGPTPASSSASPSNGGAVPTTPGPTDSPTAAVVPTTPGPTPVPTVSPPTSPSPTNLPTALPTEGATDSIDDSAAAAGTSSFVASTIMIMVVVPLLW